MTTTATFSAAAFSADAFIATAVVMLLVALLGLMSYAIGRMDGATLRREPMVVHVRLTGDELETLFEKHLDTLFRSGTEHRRRS